MDTATARLLEKIRWALRDVGGREASACRTAILVATVQEDAREALCWLEHYLAVGTGEPLEEKPRTPVPTQVGA
jgi:hypothetical protein